MVEFSSIKTAGARLFRSRLVRRGVGGAFVFVAVLFVGSYFLDEPLRRTMEKNINRDLKGYTVRLPKLHLSLLDLSLTLRELAVVQQAHPEQPVVFLPVLTASIHWREIFSGRLVAEFRLDRPKLTINLLQLRSEASDTVALKERGWQQAVAAIYPLKINSFKVTDATVTYIDQDPKKPLSLSHLNLQATNIRNISLPDQVYPSAFHLDTAIFASGRGTIDGVANFLGEPYPGIKGRVTLHAVPLDYFTALTARSNLIMDGGVLGAFGSAEFSPQVKTARLESLTIDGMKIAYTHSQNSAAAEKKRAVVVGKAARTLTTASAPLISADQVTMTGCTFTLVNKAARHPYRLYIADTDLQLRNISNQPAAGPAQAQLQGKFMGSGVTAASGSFRPSQQGLDFDLFVKIAATPLATVNDLLRAYGDFDVSAGIFSLATELHVKNQVVSGYMKPFFKGVTVYDQRRDSQRGVSHQLYEMMVGGIAGMLANSSSEEVATRVTIAGSLAKPHTSSWGIVGGLLKNAFFKALLPGFDTGARGAGKR